MFLIKLLLILFSLNSFSPTLTIPIPTPTPAITLLPDGRPPQLVILSFDGSQSLSMWKQTLEFSRSQAELGRRVPFTYFISSVYFITSDQSFGESKIGFGSDKMEIDQRIQFIKQALSDGHEIGSHLNGHTDSSNWTLPDWDREFANFSKHTGILKNKFVGFRTPNLASNNNLWPIMAQNGYLYEAGQIGLQTDWPKKVGGVWRVYLPSIHLVGTNLYPLAMDYNFYVTQSQARNLYKKGTGEWTAAHDQVVNSFLKYFHHNYSGNRAPVVFSAHFADWNDGLYWSAMQSFASQVCDYPETQCVTYKELIEYVDHLYSSAGKSY